MTAVGLNYLKTSEYWFEENRQIEIFLLVNSHKIVAWVMHIMHLACVHRQFGLR